MAYVQYDSSKIIPAPVVSITKNYLRSGDGKKIGSTFNITLTGKIFSCKGSPKTDGTFWTASGYPADEAVTDEFAALIKKINHIKKKFAEDFKWLEFQPTTGSQQLKCQPRVVSLNFPSDDQVSWAKTVNYTIELEADELIGMPGASDYSKGETFFIDPEDPDTKMFLSAASEEWNLEFADLPQDETEPHTYRLTHNLSATGKRRPDTTGLEQAQKWVKSQLGLDTSYYQSTIALGLDVAVNTYNHSRTEASNELEGSYSVTETWVLSDTNYVEDFNVDISRPADTSLVRVVVGGTVTGREESSVVGSKITVSSSKYTNASARFTTLGGGTIFTRAQTYSGETLNTVAVSYTIGKNPVSGVITYNYEYDTRQTPCIAGAISETISFQDQNPADVFARIPVIGRAGKGPVLQDINTNTETKKSMSIDVVMSVATGCPTGTAAIAALIASSPSTAVGVLVTAYQTYLESIYDSVFKETDTNSWLPSQGRYSRQVTWVVGEC